MRGEKIWPMITAIGTLLSGVATFIGVILSNYATISKLPFPKGTAIAAIGALVAGIVAIVLMATRGYEGFSRLFGLVRRRPAPTPGFYQGFEDDDDDEDAEEEDDDYFAAPDHRAQSIVPAIPRSLAWAFAFILLIAGLGATAYVFDLQSKLPIAAGTLARGAR